MGDAGRRALRVAGALVALALLVLLARGVYRQFESQDAAPAARPGAPTRSATRRRAMAPPEDPGAARAALRAEVRTEPRGRPCEWTLHVLVREGESLTRRGAGEGPVGIEGLAPARARVTVSAPGFLDDRKAVDLPSGATAEVPVTLRALATLAGRVDGPDGPVEGAHVFLAVGAHERARLGFVGAENARRLGPARTLTDAAGEFTFTDVVPSHGYVLEVRHQEYAPLQLDAVAVEPGAREELVLRLAAGAYLTGRILDHRGRPLDDVRLDVLVPDTARPHVWDETSTVRTKSDGSFRTAPVGAGTCVLLRATATRDGVHVPLNHWTDPIQPGGTDLGILRVRAHVVTFRLPAEVAPEGVSFLAAGERDTATGAVGAMTATLAFDARGEVRVAGMGPGRVNYSAWRPPSAGPGFEAGSYVDDGTERVVQLVSLPHDPPSGSVRVRPAVRAGATAYVLLVQDGDIRFGGPVRAGRPFDAGGYVGDYTVYLVEDGDVGGATTTITDGGTAEVNVSATTAGLEARLTVLDGGEPVAGASIGVYGFTDSSHRFAFSWGETDSAGRATLRGVPPDAPGLKIAVTAPSGDGRIVFVPRTRFSGATLDLRDREVR